jgi:maltose/moltooligosaccharide transporter
MPKKEISYNQMFTLAVSAFGVWFALALQMAHTTSLLKFLGVNSSQLSFIWLAGPCTGFLVQPIIGQLSDFTWTKYGKRNPYIFTFGILAAISLVILAFSTSVFMAAVMLWIFFSTINGAMEGIRALTSDLTPDPQKTLAFSVQAVASGVASGAAALLPWIFEHIFSHTTVSMHQIPWSLKLSLLTGAVVITACVFWQVRRTKEKASMRFLLLRAIKNHLIKKTLSTYKHFFLDAYHNIVDMPPVLRRLSIVQFFTWVGMFCMIMYFSLSLAQHVYGLPNNASDTTTNATYLEMLNKGMAWSGVAFGVYQFSSVFYVLILPKLAEKFHQEFLHAIALFLGGLGLALTCFIKNEYAILYCMVLVGIATGSVVTMPYVMVTSQVPKSKVGVYLGVLNVTVTFPQIVTSIFLGPLTVYIFRNHATFTVFLGSISIFVAAAIMLKQHRTAEVAAAEAIPQTKLEMVVAKISQWMGGSGPEGGK